MRWLKHLTSARHDEALAELLDEHGAEGYGVWWIILEMIGRQMDNTNKCSARYSIKKWAKSCQVSPKKFQKVVSFLSKLEKLLIKKCQNNSNFLIIECPNLLKYRDEYSKKSGQAPDKLRTKSGVTPEQIQKQKTEEERKKEKKLPFQPDSAKPLSKSEFDFSALLMEKEIPFLSIFEQTAHQAVWKSPEEDAEYRSWLLSFTQTMVAFGIDKHLIVKAINNEDEDRARGALAHTLEMKRRIEEEGQEVKNISGLFVNGYERKLTTEATEKELARERALQNVPKPKAAVLPMTDRQAKQMFGKLVARGQELKQQAMEG